MPRSFFGRQPYPGTTSPSRAPPLALELQRTRLTTRCQSVICSSRCSEYRRASVRSQLRRSLCAATAQTGLPGTVPEQPGGTTARAQNRRSAAHRRVARCHMTSTDAHGREPHVSASSRRCKHAAAPQCGLLGLEVLPASLIVLQPRSLAPCCTSSFQHAHQMHTSLQDVAEVMQHGVLPQRASCPKRLQRGNSRGESRSAAR